jgi:hypothetical protein
MGIWRLVPRLQYAEEKPRQVGLVQPADEAKPREGPVYVAPLAMAHRGRRGLMRALLFRHRCNWFPRPGETRTRTDRLRALPGRLAFLVYTSWGPLLATLAVALTRPSNVQLLLPILAGLTTPTFVWRPPNHRLWLLGASYRQQSLHNLGTILLLAALPAVLAGTITGFVGGWSIERAGVLVLLAGVWLCRAGLPGLLGDNEFDLLHRWRTRRTVVLLALLAGLFTVPRVAPDLSAIWPLWVGCALSMAGVVGVGLRYARLQEPLLMRELVEVQEATDPGDEELVS